MNALQNFHVCNPGLAQDIAHDLFHGCFKKDLELVIEVIVLKDVISILMLNNESKILAKKLKVSIAHINDDCSIVGSMSEIYNLIIYFSLMLRDFNVGRLSNVWKMYIAKLDITRIVTADEISKDQIVMLNHLITDFFEIRKIAFPDAKYFPKHQMLRFGPLKKYWTMHFEHMHQRHKYHAGHSRNFINIEQLLTTRNQQYQVTQYNDRVSPEFIYEKKFDCHESESYNLNNIIYTFIVKKIQYRGVQFAISNFVVVDASYNTLKIREINQILMSECNSCLFIGTEVEIMYDSKTGLYLSSKSLQNNNKINIDIRKILYHKPIKVLKCNEKLLYTPKSTVPFVM